VLASGPSAAQARIIFSAQTRLADPSVVGSTANVGSIEFDVTATGADATGNGTVPLSRFNMTPACPTNPNSFCSGEPGVFSFQGDGIGAVHTACAGIHFAIDFAGGEAAFTPPADVLVGLPESGIPSSCKVNFLYSTLALPETDVDVFPGIQTYQLVDAQVPAGMVIIHVFGIDETTVSPAPQVAAQPSATTPSAPVAPLAGQQSKCKKHGKRAKKKHCKRHG
jgi:hypothetical protein